MRVFKFGGASVKDEAGLYNVVDVLRQTGANDLVIVVSAMGKTTNALERVAEAIFSRSEHFNKLLEEVRSYHFDIINRLKTDQKQLLFAKIEAFFAEIEQFFADFQGNEYDALYDRIVPYGELISSTILQAVLKEEGIASQWIDARKLLKTDSSFREAKVAWELTQQNVQEQLPGGKTFLTQGFIGSDRAGSTTTLGREGSDYTAAIIAYCLAAKSVTIWKDVPGILNADPRYFKETHLLNTISYKEAIELAFYGASVIHPKTLQPLQKKGIPLYVKSFWDPGAAGTCINEYSSIAPEGPCFILKPDVILIKLTTLDFSFILEEHLGEVFKMLAYHRLKVDLIQRTALSFTLCIEDKFNTCQTLLQTLQNQFKTEVVTGVKLYTVKFYNQTALNLLEEGNEVLVRQVSGNMAQLVVK